MTEPRMSEEQLAAIVARADAATPGPWSYASDIGSMYASRGERMEQIAALMPRARDGNGPFIAHAREDVPALLLEVRRLRAENEDLHLVAQGIKHYWHCSRHFMGAGSPHVCDRCQREDAQAAVRLLESALRTAIDPERARERGER